MNSKMNLLNKYTITIIDENDIRNICLDDFKKDIITFGRGEDNDIILKSLLVSNKHGYFKIDSNGIMIVDNNSTNGIFINNSKVSNYYLRDGDSIKIDNPIEPLKRGIILVFTFGKEINEWKQYDLNLKNEVTLGRDSNCDIVFEHISTSLHHASIFKTDNGYILQNNNNSGVMVNGCLLNGKHFLKEKDVILIANAKFIYNKGRILYQVYDKGVRLDAIDIVKTVKVKGKKKNIAHHVDLTVKPGEFVSFIGGSGAGKTTFMNCISGIYKPTSGRVFINGNDLFSNYQTLKNIIGYVPQSDIVHADLTLIDMLNYAVNLRMPDDTTDIEKKKRIEEVLSVVELKEQKDVMIRNLSGGQRKRASIAVELIADPKLFFLDEPTSGLDPGTERSMMKTLRKMANSGKTIILVTHNTLNLHLCDKVVFFGNGGKLCFSGTPSDALDFFGQDDFVDVYTSISENTDLWYEKFNNSSYKEVVTSSEEVDNVSKIKNNKSFSNQWLTLTRRYIKTIINNKVQLALLLLQGPLIAFLLSLAINDTIFEYYEVTKYVMFIITCATMWLGVFNSIQVICKERIILEKEHMADLKVSSYIASKFTVLLLLAIVQAFLLISLFSLVVNVPVEGILFGWYFDMILVSFLTILTSSSLGLVVSAVSKDSSIAMAIAPLILVPQLLFANVLFKIKGVVGELSNFVLCRWSMEAYGTINDLNSLFTTIQDVFPGYDRGIESVYLFTINHFLKVLGVMTIMTLILLMVCYFILKRQLEGRR